MSTENAAIVRRALEAATRKPKPDFDTMNALFHPEHEYFSGQEALEGGVRRGARGYRDWLVGTEEDFEWHTTVEEVTAIDEDRVLAVVPTIFHTPRGVSLEQRMGALVTVRDGKVVRTEIFQSPQDALEAAGRSE
jgi:ketosteroid isomerase-like protein